MPLVKRASDAAAVSAGRQAYGAHPDALLALLRSSVATETERRRAALDLGAFPAVAAALAVVLPEEPVASVRDAIAIALVKMGTAEAAEGLAAALASGDAGVRGLAGAALRRMGRMALPAVESAIGAADPDFRLLAVGVLDAMPAERARPLLRRVMAEEREVNVALAAVEALAQIGDAADAPALLAFAGRFPDQAFVGFAVRVACRSLGAEHAA
jgi:HEAT repeat protein